MSASTVATRKYGSAGIQRRVVTNSYEVTKAPTKPFYQYSEISPEPKTPRQAHEIMDRLQNHAYPSVFTPKAIYDGKAILFVSHQLQLGGGNSGEFDVRMSDRPVIPGAPLRGVFKVMLVRDAAQAIDFSALADYIKSRTPTSQELQQVRKPSPATLTAINLLQLLIRAAPNLIYPHNSRSYFTEIGKESIGGGLELWRGFYQSVRPSINKVLVNIDVSTIAMIRSDTLLNVAMDVLNSREVRKLELVDHSQDFRHLKSFLKNKMVMVRAGPKSYKKKIRDLVAYAGKYSFDKEGMQTTVAEYYSQAYQIKLRYPTIFGIQVGNKDRDIVIPAELCTVLGGQIFQKKVPDALTDKVVKFATQRPDARLRMIEQNTGNATAPIFEYDHSPFMQDAGMKVSQTAVRIDGRLLRSPTLEYAANQSAKIKNGAWNLIQTKFKIPATVRVWMVADFTRNTSKRDQFARTLRESFALLGMKTPLDPYLCSINGQPESGISENLRNHCQRAFNQASTQNQKASPPDQIKMPDRVELIIAILEPNQKPVRTAIKRFGDVEAGIPTQCICVAKIKDGRASIAYCSNVALKINVRLGGQTSITTSPVLTKLQETPFMIVGADVGHPGAGIQNQPSVASLVWSHDKYALKYAAFSRVQPPRQETIGELALMMAEAVDAFGTLNQVPPKRIFFFRDGLSEGEFAEVGANEIKAIEAGIKLVWQRRNITSKFPEITFIVVGKRHHVRFFPENASGADNSGNCPAGFIADRGLDSPLAPDFYLQSHGGLQGTSRPSHYTVLRDDVFGGQNPDPLQELCYTLCHCYAKATRSVSIPAPVYYADLVCSRATIYFDDRLHYDDSLTSSSGGQEFNLDAWKQGYRTVNARLQSSMYFL